MFITFEGCEASGKSTQSHLLKKRLESLHYKVWLTREPGGSELADDIRKILFKKEIEDGITELFLISAARREHVKVIKEKIKDGYIVISDRFSDSSLSYQGAKHRDDKKIKTIIEYSTDNFIPNITFLLDLEIGQLMRRISLSSEHKSFYDQKDHDFHDEIRRRFLSIASEYKERIKIVNGSDSSRKVAENIWKHINPLLKKQ